MNEISCTRVKLEKKNYLRTNLAEKNSFAQTESRFFKVMSQSLPAVEQKRSSARISRHIEKVVLVVGRFREKQLHLVISRSTSKIEGTLT